MIAEGIESADQAEFVRRSGCHLGQGHYWAPAVSAEQITEIIRSGGRIVTRPAAPSVPAQPTPASGQFWRDTPGVSRQD